MTVTELAILSLKPHASLPSPELSPHFALLNARQPAWSGYPMRFYTSANKVMILSGWTDVPAHNAWIASEGNQELLGLLLPHLSIELFVHLDVPFERVPDLEALALNEVTATDVEHLEVAGRDVEGKDARCWQIVKVENGKDGDGVWKRVSRSRLPQCERAGMSVTY